MRTIREIRAADSARERLNPIIARARAIRLAQLSSDAHPDDIGPLIVTPDEYSAIEKWTRLEFVDDEPDRPIRLLGMNCVIGIAA